MPDLIEAVYQPSGSLWQRFGDALFTAYVNVHLRIAEQRAEDDPYEFIEDLKEREPE